MVIQRYQRVQRHHAAVGDAPPDADRRVEDVIALDLEEERALDLVRLRSVREAAISAARARDACPRAQAVYRM
jgi:hypothetical protein